MAAFGKTDATPQIQLVLGPMYSGKTSELIRRVRRYTHARKRCCIIKYARDTRYSEECVASHDLQLLPGLPCTRLADVAEKACEYDVIAVDEGQFFPDIVEFAEATANKGKVVVIAALDGDFRRKPFGRVLELVPLAEKIDKLTAVCTRCLSDAAFTQRTVKAQEIELIGGAESYRPVCRSCFHDLREEGGSPVAMVEGVAAGEGGSTTPPRKSEAVEEGATVADPHTPASTASPGGDSVGSSGGAGKQLMDKMGRRTPDPTNAATIPTFAGGEISLALALTMVERDD